MSKKVLIEGELKKTGLVKELKARCIFGPKAAMKSNHD